MSLPYDQRLAPDDLAGSRAHVRGLARGGILSAEETDAVLAALDEVEAELAQRRLRVPAVRRGHPHRRRAAGHRAGRARRSQAPHGPEPQRPGRHRPPAVHEARRSRPWRVRVGELQEVLLGRGRGRRRRSTCPATPTCSGPSRSLLAHHLLAHGWALARDVDRLIDCRTPRSTCRRWAPARWPARRCPLDPEATAADLGFAEVFENSLDAVSDRDFVAEALFALALLGVHLSRIGEEVVLWTTEEFGFARLDDAYATGSSMLPQKKNPDIAELARGKSGRLIGNLTGFLATLKGLPLAYNRDLQEDKEPLFDAVDQVLLALGAVAGLLATLEFDGDRMRAAADTPTSSATDLAEHLVEQGTPVPRRPRDRGRARPRVARQRGRPRRPRAGAPRAGRGRGRAPRSRDGRHPAHHARRGRPRGRAPPDGALPGPPRRGRGEDPRRPLGLRCAGLARRR